MGTCASEARLKLLALSAKLGTGENTVGCVIFNAIEYASLFVQDKS